MIAGFTSPLEIHQSSLPHPAADYVRNKYKTYQESCGFHEFLIHSDALVAACLFHNLVTDKGELPPHYLGFLRFFKFEDDAATWKGLTSKEKAEVLAAYFATIPSVASG